MIKSQDMKRLYRKSDIQARGDDKIAGFSTNIRNTMSQNERTEFGRRLMEARKRAGLTQSELAKRVGIGQSTLADSERLAIGSTYTVQLAKELGVSPSWLATGHEEGESPQEPQARIIEGNGQQKLLLEQPDGTYSFLGVEARKEDAMLPKLSPMAQELGEMFDMLTDKIGRAIAYSAALQAIVGQLPKRGEKPNDTQEQSAQGYSKTPL